MKTKEQVDAVQIAENERMRQESGMIKNSDKLVSFLYELIRDHIPAGVIEDIMKNSSSGEECLFTNGWLAQYAQDVAKRLKG